MINSSKIQAILACTCLLIILAIIIVVVVLHNYWNKKAKEIVKRKCEEYAKLACEHRKEEQSLDEIVDGVDASLGMFPHMAFVVIFQKSDPNWGTAGFNVCGGSLISEYFVLSAAHCTNNLKDPTSIVKLGSVASSLFDGTGKLFDVQDIIVHPTYKSGDKFSDILLLKLDEKVEFSSTIRPICLNTEFEAEKYGSVIVAGWGKTRNGPISIELQKIDLRTDGEMKSRCDQWFSKVGLESGGILLCAGSPYSVETPHHGDSGGPTKILLKDKCPNLYEQIAIIILLDNTTAIGTTKGQLSFHLKVEPFIYWIASIVWPDGF